MLCPATVLILRSRAESLQQAWVEDHEMDEVSVILRVVIQVKYHYLAIC